jgi:hypothetical protein
MCDTSMMMRKDEYTGKYNGPMMIHQDKIYCLTTYVWMIHGHVLYITYYLIKVAASSLLTGSREFCKSADDPPLYYTTTLY